MGTDTIAVLKGAEGGHRVSISTNGSKMQRPADVMKEQVRVRTACFKDGSR